jgi:uncharacterized protein (TIGR00725 family)
MTAKNKFIAVIGNSKASASEIKLAEEIGREIAKSGAVLVCGGLDGVMEAACRGASSAGGLTVGILPGTDRKDANRYVQIPIVTGIGYARNVIVVKSAQAVIAVGGGYGTLTEIGYALKNGIPVIGLGTWKLSNNEKSDDSIIRAENAADAVAMAVEMIAD